MKFFSAFIFLFVLSTPVYAETVFLSAQDALKQFFATSEEVTSEKFELTADQIEKAQKILKSEITRTKWTFFIAKTNSKIDGYAAIDNQVGKVEPITQMTALNVDGSIKAVEVLVYRESHGGEVQRSSFVKQFVGKNGQNFIRIGSDIKNISGATLSSNAMALSVKRVVAVWNVLYGNKQ